MSLITVPQLLGNNVIGRASQKVPQFVTVFLMSAYPFADKANILFVNFEAFNQSVPEVTQRLMT